MISCLNSNCQISASDIISLVAVVVSISGMAFGLFQWHKSNIYRRADIVSGIVDKVRDDDDIAHMMDLLDWDYPFVYDGDFKFIKDINDRKIIYDKNLFIKIDKCLAHFSYICYLLEQAILTNEDVILFEYELRRIVDNENIANYLYSIYHWSSSLKTHCSYYHLIRYAIDKNYLRDDFWTYDKDEVSKSTYTCFLQIDNPDYHSSKWNHL